MAQVMAFTAARHSSPPYSRFVMSASVSSRGQTDRIRRNLGNQPRGFVRFIACQYASSAHCTLPHGARYPGAQEHRGGRGCPQPVAAGHQRSDPGGLPLRPVCPGHRFAGKKAHRCQTAHRSHLSPRRVFRGAGEESDQRHIESAARFSFPISVI